MLSNDRSFMTEALTLNTNGNVFLQYYESGAWKDDTEYKLRFFRTLLTRLIVNLQI